MVSNILNIKNINLQSSQENTSEWDSLAYFSIVYAEKEFNFENIQEKT